MNSTDRKALRYAVFPLTIYVVSLRLKYLPQRPTL